MDFKRKLYCAFSAVNLALLTVVVAVPLWQYYHVPETYFSQEFYFVVGLWSVCEYKRCHPLYGTDVFFLTVQVLAVIALVCSCFAFLSSWELLGKLTKINMFEGLVSFGGHILSAICLTCALTITFITPTVFGITGYLLLPHFCFYLGCLVCLFSLALGIVRILWYNRVSFADERIHKCPWICPLNFYRNVFYVVACIHFVLVVFVTVTPFWLASNQNDIKVILGFWAICFQLKCHPLGKVERPIIITRVLLIVASASLLMVLVPARHIYNRYSHRTRLIPESLIATAAEFCAGVCLLLPVIVVFITTSSKNDRVSAVPHWNFYIASFCCVLAFSLGSLNVFWGAHVRASMLNVQNVQVREAVQEDQA